MYQYLAHTIDDNKMLTQVNMGGVNKTLPLHFVLYIHK